MSNSRPGSPIVFEKLSLDDDGYSEELRNLINVLNTDSGLRMFKNAYRKNILFKIDRYTELQLEAERDVLRQEDIIKIKQPELKRISEATNDDNWQIFESISDQYNSAKSRESVFEALKRRAKDRLAGTLAFADIEKSGDAIRPMRAELVKALEELSNFATQAHVVAKVVDIVGSFLKHPSLFQTKLMNFMLVGSAGTGKTTLAAAIGNVLAKAGIFVGNQLVVAGRAELVASYEGQTVSKTRNFLIDNLDNGIVFIDEAYAITPWSNGKPESYGSEAATAMVEFMTTYPGLYCIIVAGYERDMTRYFLETNEGLNRRFPNKYTLYDSSPETLVHIMKRALITGQGIKAPNGNKAVLVSENYFDSESWRYILKIITASLSGKTRTERQTDQSTMKTYERVRVFDPQYPRLYQIFSNRAGSMVNLADEAITVLVRNGNFENYFKIIKKEKVVPSPIIPEQQPVVVMREILVNTILKSALSDYDAFVAELISVEKQLGL